MLRRAPQPTLAGDVLAAVVVVLMMAWSVPDLFAIFGGAGVMTLFVGMVMVSVSNKWRGRPADRRRRRRDPR